MALHPCLLLALGVLLQLHLEIRLVLGRQVGPLVPLRFRVRWYLLQVICLVMPTGMPQQVQATSMVQQLVWHQVFRYRMPSELGNHPRERLLDQLMIPLVRQVFDHLRHPLPRSVTPSLLNIPLMSTQEGRQQKNLDKLLIIRELIPHHLALDRVAHLSGTQMLVITIDFNLTSTHSLQLRPLLRPLFGMFLGRCEW